MVEIAPGWSFRLVAQNGRWEVHTSVKPTDGLEVCFPLKAALGVEEQVCEKPLAGPYGDPVFCRLPTKHDGDCSWVGVGDGGPDPTFDEGYAMGYERGRSEAGVERTRRAQSASEQPGATHPCRVESEIEHIKRVERRQAKYERVRAESWRDLLIKELRDECDELRAEAERNQLHHLEVLGRLTTERDDLLMAADRHRDGARYLEEKLEDAEVERDELKQRVATAEHERDDAVENWKLDAASLAVAQQRVAELERALDRQIQELASSTVREARAIGTVKRLREALTAMSRDLPDLESVPAAALRAGDQVLLRVDQVLGPQPDGRVRLVAVEHGPLLPEQMVVRSRHVSDRGYPLAGGRIEGAWQADALSALVKLVRQDNPDLSLAEIGGTWGEDLSAAELSALAALDAQRAS